MDDHGQEMLQREFDADAAVYKAAKALVTGIIVACALYFLFSLSLAAPTSSTNPSVFELTLKQSEICIFEVFQCLYQGDGEVVMFPEFVDEAVVTKLVVYPVSLDLYPFVGGENFIREKVFCRAR